MCRRRGEGIKYIKSMSKRVFFSLGPWYTRLGRGARDWGERLTTLVILCSPGRGSLCWTHFVLSQGLAHPFPFPPFPPQRPSLDYHSQLSDSLILLPPLTSRSSLSSPAGYSLFRLLPSPITHHPGVTSIDVAPPVTST